MIGVYGIMDLAKINRLQWTDFCPHCGQMARIQCYTAEKFVHLNFIPLLPIGAVRVMSRCPLCKLMQRFAPKDARAIADAALDRARRAFEQGRTDEGLQAAFDAFVFGRCDQAQELLDSRGSMEPNARLTRGRMHHLRRQWFQAEQLYREVIASKGPQECIAGAHRWLGMALWERKRLAQAEEELSLSAAISPTDDESRCALMLILRDQKRWLDVYPIVEQLAAMGSHVAQLPAFAKVRDKARKAAAKAKNPYAGA